MIVGSIVRWGLQFKLMPDRQEFTDYVGRLEERPALQRTVALDAELAAAS